MPFTIRAGSKHTFGFVVAAAILQFAFSLRFKPLEQQPWDDGRGEVAANGEADATPFKSCNQNRKYAVTAEIAAVDASAAAAFAYFVPAAQPLGCMRLFRHFEGKR